MVVITVINDTPIIKGSALAALNGEQSGVDSVMELMNTVDTWIETPVRDEAKALDTEYRVRDEAVRD